MLALNNANGITVFDAQSRSAVPATPINFYSALSVPAYYRAVTFLSDNLASLPRSVTQDGTKPPTPHPLDKLLNRRPNGYQNSTMLWRTLFFHAAHYQNGYVRIERDPLTLRPVALHTLMSEGVLPFRYDDGQGGGPVQYFKDLKTGTIYLGDDVIHLAACSYDGMRGIDGTALHTGTLQQAATLDKFTTKYLMTGTNIRGSIEFQGELTKEKADQVRQQLREQFQGIDAQDDVILLGDATLKNATTSPQQSQLVEMMAMSTKKIAQVVGVPPEFLFDKSETKYTGIEEAGQNVVRYTLRPWIEQIEDECSRKLLTDEEQDAGYRVYLDTNALTRGDRTAEVGNATKLKLAGIYTANDALKELGEPDSKDPEASRLKASGDTAPTPNA